MLMLNGLVKSTKKRQNLLKEKSLLILRKICYNYSIGRVAELVDALDSKSGDSNVMRVRFPPRPPEIKQGSKSLFLCRCIPSPPITENKIDVKIDVNYG